VRFDGYQLEFRPSGRLLFIRNLDVPGVVGRVGGILGDAGTNIAEIHLSRRTGGTDAIAVLRLDQVPGEELLGNLEALSEIQSVQFIDLGSP
jgi:D-3-phosphoglycerate dehydrogenase